MGKEESAKAREEVSLTGMDGVLGAEELSRGSASYCAGQPLPRLCELTIG